ncbi:SHOCT domain-containing protein, partial [Escherichia coli]|nr:SHOCT domain-containing protein [Escherichia coli]
AENFAFQPSMSEELERLHQLLQTGAITQVEFDNLKTKLLGSA